MKTSPWKAFIHSEGCSVFQDVNVPYPSYVPLIVSFAQKIMPCKHLSTHILMHQCFDFNGINSRSRVSDLKNAHIFNFSRCCSMVSEVSITLHISMRQEYYLPFKVQEAEVQRWGMCLSSSMAELKTKHLPGFQTNAFPPKYSASQSDWYLSFSNQVCEFQGKELFFPWSSCPLSWQCPHCGLLLYYLQHILALS